jgi:hypothetical protein
MLSEAAYAALQKEMPGQAGQLQFVNGWNVITKR